MARKKHKTLLYIFGTLTLIVAIGMLLGLVDLESISRQLGLYSGFAWSLEMKVFGDMAVLGILYFIVQWANGEPWFKSKKQHKH